MKAIALIKDHLKAIPEGEPFTTGSLRHLATADNLRQILNRLVKIGVIKRVSRGVYVKPKYEPHLGETLPLVSEIAETIAKSTGEVVAIHGAEAARQLGLTTQVPMRLVLHTSGNTREVKVKNQSVLLKHVSPSKLIAPNTIAGLVISALLYLGQQHVTPETLQKISSQFGPKDFETTLKQIEFMPAWLANIFYRFNKELSNES
ncbi:MAG: DUF6088 family protein [Chlamydiales bacterium]|nr:DUF6088 family protein [Chlamydiales bacterium]